MNYRADVPGTAAAAVSAAVDDISAWDFDAHDWWYRTEFDCPADGRTWRLQLDGLATVADVWLNGALLLHTENMFRSYDLDAGELLAHNNLQIHFHALTPLLAARRPRPRWKVARLRSQNLRWFRTSLLGRLHGWAATPAPVGPWRAVRLIPADEPRVVASNVLSDYDPASGTGIIEVSLALANVSTASLLVGGHRVELTRGKDGEFCASVPMPDVRAWWPHTHGDQPLYPITVECAGVILPVGRVGFRSVEVDRSDDGFRLVVNGVEIFCRGACWLPPDPVGLGADEAQLRAALTLMRAGNLNIVRFGAETVYPEPALLDLCDELGILVWHDCMFAFVDLPDDAGFHRDVEAELRQRLGSLQGRPSVAVVSGGGETEQQATYQGLDAASGANSFFTTTLPAIVDELLPGLPYVSSSPSGGALATDARSGVSHYYGVGAYRRGLDDARRSGVRFAAECLAFSTPPERPSIERAFGGAAVAGHHPAWKAGIYRDANTSWDFEDVRDHYVRSLYSIEPAQVRFLDPERALDLGRAVVADVVTATLSEWRRTGSGCAGAIVFSNNDLVAGAGLGLVDVFGRPKSSWYAMRRAMAPVAVLLTDEGLNGIDAHLVNDTSGDIRGTLRVSLFAHGELCVETAEVGVLVPARSGATVALAGVFQGFRDLNNAHVFGPPAFDVITVTLLDEAGETLADLVHTPQLQPRPVEADIGMTVAMERAGDGWHAVISTRRFAQWVSIETPNAVPADSWFHIAPGSTHRVGLGCGSTTPRGRVQALNCAYPVPLPSATS